MNSRRTLIALLLVLSFLGLADSWYLFQSAITDTALSCNIGGGLDGCNAVAKSPYSHLFGVPLALYGVGFYAFLFVLAAALAFLPKRSLYRASYLAAIFGALASVAFLLVQFLLIKAVCIYCIASAVFAFLILAIARRLWKRHAPRQPAETGS